jgi:hypothetical protein
MVSGVDGIHAESLSSLFCAVNKPDYSKLMIVLNFIAFQQGCDDPFSIALDPQILAALSCQVALFPSISTHADDSYPPQARRMPSSSDIANTACKPPTPSSNGKFQRSSHSRVQVKSAPSTSADDCRKPAAVKSCGNVDDAATGQFKRTMSVRRKLAPVDFAPSRQGQSTMLPMAQLPLSDETLGSLLTFCFPGNHCLCKVYVLSLINNRQSATDEKDWSHRGLSATIGHRLSKLSRGI